MSTNNLDNILAENMRRFNTKNLNLDLYDELMLEGSSIRSKVMLSFAVAGGILLGTAVGVQHHKQKNKWIQVYNKVKQLDPTKAAEIDSLIGRYDFPEIERRSGRRFGTDPDHDQKMDAKLDNAIDVFIKDYTKNKPGAPDALDLDADGDTDELLKNTFK